MDKINYIIKIKNKLDNEPYYYIDKNIMDNIIKSIDELFPILNLEDKSFLLKLSARIIDFTSLKFNFNNIPESKEQWLINDNKDIKSMILSLLPFLDNTKDDGKVLKSMTSFRQMLINNDGHFIDSSSLEKARTDMMKKELYYSNFAINLIDDYENPNLDGDIISELMIMRFHTLMQSIKLMNHKLYVNWINVVPILMDNYMNESCYINTVEKMNKILKRRMSSDDLKYELILNNLDVIKFNDNDNIHLLNYYGVFSGLIYNSLKKIKWLIYCRNITSDKGYYYIQILDKMLSLNKFLKFNSFDECPTKEKKELEKQLNTITNNIKTNKKITFDKDINNELEFNVLTVMMKFIVSNNNKYKFSSIYNKFKINDDEVDNNIINDRIISRDELSTAIINIDRNLLWDYIKDSLERLRHNYLGNKLFEGNNINHNYYYYNNTNITIKNIYNYGKIITFKDFEKREKYNMNVLLLYPNEIYDIFRKIKLTDENNFISNNLRIQFSGRNVPREWFNIIKTNLLENIHKIVFETLIHNGLLSKFTVNHDINDNSKLPSIKKMSDIKKTKKLSKILGEYQQANYFFNNSKYSSMKSIYHEENEKVMSYIDQLLIPGFFDFYQQYSFNWIFQINFLNHFYYNQVNYVTGATGQGKSTQMPKLYAYSFKAFNFKSNPKIAITQPRFDPTEGVSKWVSREVGLPLGYKKGSSNISTNNYFLQFKHSKNYHIKDNCYHPSIVYMTDGTILNTINNNPSLEEQYYDTKTKKWVSIENSAVYDAILVDEAHEHNTNMDLILSDLRISCTVNKNVKLSIISATMDDDEPVYRAFYNFVNYEVLSGIHDFVDPRIHISPPGQTTKYKIVEHYENNEAIYDIENKTILKVLEILKNYPSGQILVFSTGQADIIKLVQKLNKRMANDVIALPYFSAMHSNYKKMVSQITNILPKLKNRKDRIDIEWGEKFIEDMTVPNNIYKRAVIIATNVAEASITIPGLKFVVDNGYAKVRKYDMLQQTKAFSIEMISEASRLQRKGRVGRKDSGDVFYLYPKGAREKIMPKYKITQEDTSDIILNVLNNYENIEKIKKMLLNKFGQISDFSSLLMSIIQGKIVDYNGMYNIVNPFEDKIVRNIFHKIILFNDLPNKTIDFEVYQGFLEKLASNLMIYFQDSKTSKIYFKIKDNIKDSYEIIPTEFFKAVQQTSGKLMMEQNFIISIIMSKLAGVFNEMILIIPFIMTLENGINGIAARDDKKLMLDKLIEKYGRYSSDIETIHRIVLDFKNTFSDFGIFELLDDDGNSNKKFITKMKYKFNEQLKNYSKYVSYNNTIFKENEYIDEDTYEVFLKLTQDKIYDDELKFKKWFLHNNYLSELFINDFKKSNKVKKWCINNFINYESFSVYYKKLVELIIKIYSLDSIIDESNNEINYIKSLGDDSILVKSKSKVSNMNIIEKLELCFLYGFNKNIYIRRPTNKVYHSFYSLYHNIEINNMFGKNLTFNLNPSEIICGIYKVNKEGVNMANIIFNVNPSILSKFLGNIFNRTNFKLEDTKIQKSNINNVYEFRIIKFQTNKYNNIYYTIYNNYDISYHLLFNKNIKNSNNKESLYKILKQLIF